MNTTKFIIFPAVNFHILLLIKVNRVELTFKYNVLKQLPLFHLIACVLNGI